jgi:GAF domain-containing protein
VAQIYEQFGYDLVALFRMDDQGHALILQGYTPQEYNLTLHQHYSLNTQENLLVAAAAVQDTWLIVSDYESEKAYSRLSEFHDIHSELALPLRIRDEVIGILDIASTQPHSFTPQDAPYMQIMADQIAMTLDNAILLASSEERLHEIERLLGIQRVHGWQNIVSGRHGLTYTYDGSSIYKTQNQFLSQDDPDLTIPLICDYSELGQFSFQFPEDRIPNDNVVNLAHEIAKEAGQAMERARNFTETQEAMQEAGFMYRAIQAVVAATTPGEVLDGFINNLIAPGIEQCLLLIKLDSAVTDKGSLARIEAGWNAGMDSAFEIGEVWDLEQIPVFSARVLVVNDIESSTELDALSKSILLDKGLRALMLVPLGNPGVFMGWLMINSLKSPYKFTDRQIQLYSAFAVQLTQALQNIRLVQASRKRIQEEQYVREAAERMHTPVDMKDVIDVAADEIRRILDLDDVVVRLTLPESDNSK